MCCNNLLQVQLWESRLIGISIRPQPQIHPGLSQRIGLTPRIFECSDLTGAPEEQ